jgi:hypothetical protein
MLGRINLLVWTASALLVAGITLGNAADEVHEGKVVSVAANSLVVLDNRDGDNDKFVVNAETKITRNGKPAKLTDILAGDRAKVIATASGEQLVAKSVAAMTPE